jgi:hypothetical protein
MVKDLANAATCVLRYFSCALSSADADVLSSDCCALADVAGSVDGVQGDEIAGAFANVTAGTAGLGRGLSLGGNAQATDGEN